MTLLKVLVVDDEPQARRVLRTALVSRGFEVTDARSGEEALEILRKESPDAILLDMKMPGMSGLETCRLIRDCSEVPIVILSGVKAEREKVEALNSGADDYIVKPFGIEELVARLHAVTRRPQIGARSRVVHLGPVEIDLESHIVKRGESLSHLTFKEFRLLHYFVQNVGKVASHRRILQAVWGPDYGNEVEYLRVFINQLRKKVEPDPSHPKHILTEPSSGYRFVLESDALGKS